MPRHAVALPVALLLAAVAAPAAGAATPGPAGFAPGLPVLLGTPSQTAAAVSERGAAVLAVVTADGDREAVRVASRGRAGAPWRVSSLRVAPREARDVQAVVTPDGMVVVAWAEAGARNAVGVATGRAGDGLSVTSTPAGSGFAASPRLAVLRSGTVLLAYRDAPRGGTSGLRLRTVRAGEGLGRARTVATRVSQVALAAAGGGAVLAWTRSATGRVPRAAYGLRLGREGAPRERAFLITRDAGRTLRLAGGPDGRSLASWMRPARGTRAAGAFTRSLRPVLRPARPLGAPGLRPRDAATLSAGPDGHALAALPAFGDDPFGFRVLAARSRMGGVWTGVRPLGAPSAMGGTPRPVLAPGGEELVAWTTARTQPGPVAYDVLISGAGGTTALGTTSSPDGRGLAVGHAGARVLVAWPMVGGLALAERG